jgi:hypothetical protein
MSVQDIIKNWFVVKSSFILSLSIFQIRKLQGEVRVLVDFVYIFSVLGFSSSEVKGNIKKYRNGISKATSLGGFWWAPKSSDFLPCVDMSPFWVVVLHSFFFQGVQLQVLAAICILRIRTNSSKVSSPK